MNENLLNKIYCGHALDILKSFLDSFVDCVVTSPPYYGLRDYKIEPEIWGGDKSCAHEWRETIVKKMRGKAGVGKTGNHSQIIPGQDKEQKQGNFCSKCSAWRGSLGLEPNFNLYLDHLILIFAEIKRVMNTYLELGRNMRCVWNITTHAFSDYHFAVFPEELPKRCIEAGCSEGGLVLDPFAGSGTTCLVAKKLGRNYIGIEKNPEYVTMAERRIERECGTLV